MSRSPSRVAHLVRICACQRSRLSAWVRLFGYRSTRSRARSTVRSAMPDAPARTPAEEREWVIWGAPCRLCGVILCECTEYRLSEGGTLERRRRVLKLKSIQDNLLNFDGSMRGVRMQFEDIKGACPSCGQNPSGMTMMRQPSGVEVRVRCSNGHWAALSEWNMAHPATALPPTFDPPKLPGGDDPRELRGLPSATPRQTGEIAAARAMNEYNPGRPETATMIQHPEEEVDPLAEIEFTLKVKASRSALTLLAADFNPTKSQSIGRMKQYVAVLITQAEGLRDKEPGAPARVCALAITKFEEGALFLEKAMRMLREP